MSRVRVVTMSHPHLGRFIYADREVVRREPGSCHIIRGVYFASPGEPAEMLKECLPYCADDVIAVVPPRTPGGDLLVEDPETYVAEISSNRGIRAAKNLYGPLKGLGEDEFCLFIKISCVQRKWARELLVKREKVYHLFSSLMANKRAFLQTYFSLRENLTAPELLSSLITFLSRIEMYEEQKEDLSEFYRKVVRKGKGQGLNIQRSIHSLLLSPPSLDLDFRIIQFCLSLRTGT